MISFGFNTGRFFMRWGLHEKCVHRHPLSPTTIWLLHLPAPLYCTMVAYTDDPIRLFHTRMRLTHSPTRLKCVHVDFVHAHCHHLHRITTGSAPFARTPLSSTYILTMVIFYLPSLSLKAFITRGSTMAIAATSTKFCYDTPSLSGSKFDSARTWKGITRLKLRAKMEREEKQVSL